MTPRVALALASVVSVAALAVAWRYHAQARAEDQRATVVARQNAELRFELKQTRERADDLANRLAEADSQLGSAKTRATATETRSALLNRELSTARAALTEREQREVALLAQLEELRQHAGRTVSVAERSSEPAPLPAPAPVVAASAPAPDLSAYERRIANLEAQLIEVLTRSLAELPAAAPEPAPTAPVEAAPQIVQIGAHQAFVVINRGSEHGVRSGEVCAFTRDGTEIALGRLSEVRPRFAIVHLLPGSLKGQLQAGDIALLAR